MMFRLTPVLILCFISLHWMAAAAEDVYSIGVGRYDITGPAVEISMV